MNIIELALQSGMAELLEEHSREYGSGTFEITLYPELEKFAALVAAQEREACCAIVYGLCESDNVAQRTVDAIRARGTT